MILIHKCVLEEFSKNGSRFFSSKPKSGLFFAKQSNVSINGEHFENGFLNYAY